MSTFVRVAAFVTRKTKLYGLGSNFVDVWHTGGRLVFAIRLPWKFIADTFTFFIFFYFSRRRTAEFVVLRSIRSAVTRKIKREQNYLKEAYRI